MEDIYYSRDPQSLDASVGPDALAIAKAEFRELAARRPFIHTP